MNALEARIAALEAIKEEQKTNIDRFYAKDWANLLADVTQLKRDTRETHAIVSNLNTIVTATLLQHSSDLKEIETNLSRLPSRALAGAGGLVAILLAIAQLAGLIKIG